MTDAAIRKAAHDTSFTVLFAIGFCHLLNDMMQALLPAIYPTLKTQFHLNFAQIGLMTLVFQCTASLFQPVVGYFADLKPMPYSLALGMVSTLVGPAGAGRRTELSGAADRRHDDRAGFGRVSSRIQPRGAHGLGRALRSGAIGVPGRRQHRLGDRPADCGRCWWRPMASAPSSGMRGWRCSASSSFSMSAPGTSITGCSASRAIRRARDSGLPRGKIVTVAGHPADADLFQILLSRQHQQLLHLLPDPHVPRVGAERPGASVLSSWARWRWAPWLAGLWATRSAANM